jgi:hypothetical protein
MKAISLWQPWASLWLSDRKVHETRHWATHHRGWLIVHAAKRIDFDACQDLGVYAETLPIGGIIGAVDLTACTRMAETAPEHQDDQDCGNWSPERFAWRRGAFVRLGLAIPYRGLQSIFEVPDTEIEELLREIALVEGAAA